MKAVRFTEQGIETLEVPKPKGGGVIIDIRSAGICSGDLSIIKGGPHPFTLGHEMAGYCEDGRAVAVEPIIPCWSCDQCRLQNYQRCRRGDQIIVSFGCDGGMAEQIHLPEHCLVPLPSGLDARDGCLVEPLSVAIRGLRQGKVTAGQRVAVIGGGTIGQLCVAGAVALGAEVALAARHRVQIAAGEQLGAQAIGNGEYDVVLECAGTESALNEGCALLRPGGTLVLLGVYYGRISLPGMEVLHKELHIVSSICYSRHSGGRDVDNAAALLAANPMIAQAVITHRFPLADAAEAFRVAQDRSAGAIKVVLEP
jgi:2-desacetyl-2-hydroxyethyl bacteriochlorophyllide A dehydrogenase